MRVQHNIASMNSYRNFGLNNSKLGKNLEKLSSGYAINRAGDDAAGLAVSEKMRWQTTGLEAAIKNAKDGIGMIQTAEGALTEVHDMLNRMNYLAEQASNGTYGTEDIANLNAEARQLLKEVNRIAASADFNGVKLLNGNLNGTTLQIGVETSDTLTLSLNADDQADDALADMTVASLFNNDDLDAEAIETYDVTGKMGDIKDAINRVSKVRANFGALQNRLEHTVNNLGVMKENITDAESRIRDTDVAEEMMRFTKNSIMNQAAQAMMAQANQLPQGVLQLLQ